MPWHSPGTKQQLGWCRGQAVPAVALCIPPGDFTPNALSREIPENHPDLLYPTWGLHRQPLCQFPLSLAPRAGLALGWQCHGTALCLLHMPLHQLRAMHREGKQPVSNGPREAGLGNAGSRLLSASHLRQLRHWQRRSQSPLSPHVPEPPAVPERDDPAAHAPYLASSIGSA